MDLTKLFNECVKSSLTSQEMATGTPSAIIAPTLTRKTLNIDNINDEFTKEAYRIAFHEADLQRFINSIRLPYLNMPNPKGSDAATIITFPFTSTEGDLAQSLQKRQQISITTMTDKDRDTLEIEIKRFIALLVNRIAEIRKKVDKIPDLPVENQKPSGGMQKSLSVVGDLFSSSKKEYKALIKEHRQNITWYLEQKLIKTSNSFKDLLERRAKIDMTKREMYRPKVMPSLGQTTFEPLKATATTQLEPPTTKSTLLPGDSKSFLDSLRSRSRSRSREPPGIQRTPLVENMHQARQELFSQDSPVPVQEDDGLSPAQRMELEKENNALLESFETQIDSVRQATQTISDISQLQTQLAFHLSAQSEQVEQIYDEAVKSTEYIRNANDQLRKAQSRFASSRFFVLIFLLFASAILLFLDWYAS